MADEPKPDDDKKPEGDKPDLGDAGKKALDEERKARREAEKQLKEMQSRLKEIEDKDKDEVDKLREANADLTKKLADTETAKLRLEVAAEKGVKARWLNGATREELEAAADEYLEDHPQTGGATPPPSRKPATDLKGGSEPSEEPGETDPAKLAENVPRY